MNSIHREMRTHTLWSSILSLLLMWSFALRVERTWRTLKYEWLFLKDYHEFDELEQSLNEFVYYFNRKRIHQSLDYQTPDEVYKQGTFPNVNNEKVA